MRAIIELTMITLLTLSYGISLWILIKTPDTKASSQRFWIKLLACVHPLLIILLASLQNILQTLDIKLIIALFFALLGDILLGLKYKSKHVRIKKHPKRMLDSVLVRLENE